MTASLNGRAHGAPATDVEPPPPAVSLSRASQAALGHTLAQALDIAQQHGLSGDDASLARGVASELGAYRHLLEQVLGHLNLGNGPAATALIQQVMGPVIELDQNHAALEASVGASRTSLLAYQAIAPSGLPEPALLMSPERLNAWAAAAEQVALTYDDLAARARARAALLIQQRPS